jgi:superfamily II DNA/RNA helicase
MSSPTFAGLGVSKPMVRALEARGIEAPFAIQELVIGDVLAGRDVLAKSPTGSGKTLAFAVPILERLERRQGTRDPRALILAPTRELAAQIVEQSRPLAQARGLEVSAVYGGVGFDKQIRACKRSDVLVATPGRLEDLLDRRAVSLARVEVLVLDEADRMLDMGFRPAVDRLVARCTGRRQTLFFSATLEGEAGRIAAEYTHEPVTREHVPPALDAPAVEHRFIPVLHEAKLDALVAELRAERGLTLVFVRTKRGADRLVKRLGRHGVDAVAMHGDKSQNQRERALASFESGKVDTLVATDVAARGIHVDGISHVINFDPPEDREGYVHRVGRTGRAGETGIGITFVVADQVSDVGKIAASLDLQREYEPVGVARGGAPLPARSGERAPRPSERAARPHAAGGPKRRRYRSSSSRW